MTEPTKLQTELLTPAASRDDGLIEGADDKTAKALIKAGHAISIPQPHGPSWLIITDKGRAALGQPRTLEAPQETPLLAATAPKAPTGKLGALVALLQRPEGVTVEAMSAATGWQPHSVRGAMSGALKKKLGLAITSTKTESGRVYRIVPVVAG